MKKNIIIIVLLFTAIIFAYCTGGNQDVYYDDEYANDGVVRNKRTPFDRYFDHVNIWNNVFYEERTAVPQYNSAIGIVNVEIRKLTQKELDKLEKYDLRLKPREQEYIKDEVIVVEYENIVDFPLGQGWGQDKKTVSIRQNDAKFKCLGGDGLKDFHSETYTAYRGLTPVTIPKAKFDEILSQLTKEDKEFVISLYDTGLPGKIEAYRFMSLILPYIIDEDKKSLLEDSYENDNEGYFKLKEDVSDKDKDKLLNIISDTGINYWPSQKYYYDYKNSYVLKYDFWGDNLMVGFNKIHTLKPSDHIRLKDLFYEIGYTPSLKWKEYFPTVGMKRNKKTREVTEVDFDITKPFNLKEICSTGCMFFKDVWVNPPEDAEAE